MTRYIKTLISAVESTRFSREKNHRALRALGIVSTANKRRDEGRKKRGKREREIENAINKLAMCQFLVLP